VEESDKVVQAVLAARHAKVRLSNRNLDRENIQSYSI
jgi:hypothetical protein